VIEQWDPVAPLRTDRDALAAQQVRNIRLPANG
jgi:hypothetical protein